MSISDFDFIQDDFGLIIPTNKIFIPSLDIETEIWFDVELKGQKKPTDKQCNVFENFLNIDNKEIMKASVRLDEYRDNIIAGSMITKAEKAACSFKNLNFRSIILPQQAKTRYNYLIILADTGWKIRHNTYVIELEILFKDNQFELLQEMTGLWCILDWYYNYNSKDTL